MEDLKQIQEFFSKPLEEMDINDPVLIKMRADKDKLAKMRAANAGDDGNDHIFRKARANVKKLEALKQKRAQIMRDMEQEAEIEGGPIADKYGAMLNKIDKAIDLLSPQKKGDEYMSYDEIQRRAAMISDPYADYTSKTNAMFGLEENDQLTEAYVPENIKEFAKRKGVSRLVNTVAGWAEKVGKRIVGGTAIGKYYNTLVLDMTYQGSQIYINCEKETVELYGEPVYSFQDFKRVYEADEEEEESVNEAQFTDYSNNELAAYCKNNPNDKAATAELKKRSQKLKDLSRTDVKEVSNDYSPLSYAKRIAAGTLDIEDAMKETGFPYTTLMALVKKIKGASSMEEGMGGQLDEKYFIEVSVRDARKALNIYDDMFDRAGIEMYGSNVYASNNFGDLYDVYMAFMNNGIEIIDSSNFDEDPDEFEDYDDTIFEADMAPNAKINLLKNIIKKVKSASAHLSNEELAKLIAKEITIDTSGTGLAKGAFKVVGGTKANLEEDIFDYEKDGINYNDIYKNYLYKKIKEVATQKGYSKFLVSKDNPKGETEGLTPDVLNKILMKIVQDIDETKKLGENLNEELCPKGKAYIKKRMAAGEKSSAYLSGRAVKVCKGQMKG